MTNLEYLENTYKFESISKVIETWFDGYWAFVILEGTIFYPKWWWQPTDIWIISSENWYFSVSQVTLDKNWIVYHYWEYKSGEFRQGEEVDLKIDKSMRIINAKSHSAWHLLDVIVSKTLPNFKAIKGFHFPEWAYLEFTWTLDIDKSELISQLNVKITNHIRQNIELEVSYPWDIISPDWKKPRYVNFKWYTGCWCGWTHVRNSWEIWAMHIRKIKNSKGNTKISYQVL